MPLQPLPVEVLTRAVAGATSLEELNDLANLACLSRPPSTALNDAIASRRRQLEAVA